MGGCKKKKSLSEAEPGETGWLRNCLLFPSRVTDGDTSQYRNSVTVRGKLRTGTGTPNPCVAEKFVIIDLGRVMRFNTILLHSKPGRTICGKQVNVSNQSWGGGV